MAPSPGVKVSPPTTISLSEVVATAVPSISVTGAREIALEGIGEEVPITKTVLETEV